METTQTVMQVIQTPRMSVSRKLAQQLADSLDLKPGAVVEINARHTCEVTNSFAEELVIALFEGKFVSKIMVRGSVPGMYAGLLENANKRGFTNRVGIIPLSSR